jgi:hypothetical protein
MVKTCIIELSAAATLLDEAELATLGGELDDLFSSYPRRDVDVNVSIAELEALLSLPLWKHRSELYSVWIATEIIQALADHDIEIHHDHGVIEFPFTPTDIATIHSASQPFKLVSERRDALVLPPGEIRTKGRTKGVQPDHELWTTDHGRDVCPLVVEVKHHKQADTAEFVAALQDYARSLPSAQVYLASHGSVGHTMEQLDREVSSRCNSIAYLTASNLAQRKELRSAVRRCVGEPVDFWHRSAGERASDTILAVDVSDSMLDIIRSEAMESFLAKAIAMELPERIAAVTDVIVGSWDATKAGYQSLMRNLRGTTGLEGVVKQLLQNHVRVLLLTDDEGSATLGNLVTSEHEAQAMAPEGLRVIVCTK